MLKTPNENFANTIALDKTLPYPPYPDQKDLDNLVGTRALKKPPKADVNLNIPYIHQLWDTPEEFHGSWACGPTCVAMVLAYYNALKPDPIKISLPKQHKSPYGRYISRSFESKGHKFQATAPTKTGGGAGLYGACVNADGDGTMFAAGDVMGMIATTNMFLKELDNKMVFKGKPKRESNARFMARAPAEEAMKTALDKGHPVIVSGDIKFRGTTYRHFIVVRGYYQDSGELMWIVNDPYGFTTTSEYDGENIVYEFAEINPKYMGILEGSFIPSATVESTAENYIPVRLFDKNTNKQIGEGTLIEGTDKVYIKSLKSVTHS